MAVLSLPSSSRLSPSIDNRNSNISTSAGHYASSKPVYIHIVDTDIPLANMPLQQPLRIGLHFHIALGICREISLFEIALNSSPSLLPLKLIVLSALHA
jgi:hypothetical protein